MVETRSRARGAGATTPHASLPNKTPGAKSTRSTRSKKAKEEAQDDVAQKLKFQEEPADVTEGATSNSGAADADTSVVDQQTVPGGSLEQQVGEAHIREEQDAMSQDSPIRGLAVLPGAEHDGDAMVADAASNAVPDTDLHVNKQEGLMPGVDNADLAEAPNTEPTAGQAGVEQPGSPEAPVSLDAEMSFNHTDAEHAVVDEASNDETSDLSTADKNVTAVVEQPASPDAPVAQLDAEMDFNKASAEPADADEPSHDQAADLSTADKNFTAAAADEQLAAEEAPDTTAAAHVPQLEGITDVVGDSFATDADNTAPETDAHEQLPADNSAAIHAEELLMHTGTMDESEVAPEPSSEPAHEEVAADVPASPEHVYSDDTSVEVQQQQLEEKEQQAPSSPLAGMSLAPSAGGKFVSKTPQPRKVSASKASASLTAAKPPANAGTPYASRRAAVTFAATPEPRPGSSSTAKAVHKTPATKATPAAAAASSTTAGKSTHKSVLKPSTTFKTPTGERTASRTGDAASKSSKRVSISSPAQQSAPRAIPHLTPYPKSAGKPIDLDDEDEEMGDSPMQDLSMADASPNSKAGPSTAPQVQPIMPVNDSSSTEEAAPAEADQESGAEERQDVEMDMEPIEDAGADAAPTPESPSTVTLATYANAGTKSGQNTPVMATRPTSSGKYAKAHSALQSLAAAEAQASGSAATSSKGTPSYMAPTSAALSRAKMPVKLGTAKPNSPDQDTRSLNQIRRQIKEVAAAKASKTGPKTASQNSGQAQVHSDLNAVRKTRLVDKVDKKAAQPVEEDIAGDNDQSEARHDPAAEELLTSAMGGMNLGPQSRTGRAAVAPLKGVPVPQGKHVRFTSKGKAKESPSNTRPVLRGVPAAEGKHLRFKD